MGIIVQKYGGTSVGTAEGRARLVSKVMEARERGSVVVVVSAMGRRPSPYATDTLLDLVANTSRPVSARELDALISCGETISSVVIAAALSEAGCDAVSLSGAQAGILTDDCYGQARITRIDTARILRHLDAGKVVVVAGFQGVNQDGDITTLGRGGSDTTAAALGAALAADVVEIYTDVQGIMTADPNIVPEARWQDTMTYTEVVEMANLGAKVVHLQAVEIAMHSRTPMAIRNTFSDSPGTMITDMSGQRAAAFSAGRPVTAVTTVGERAQVIAEVSQDSSSMALDVFSSLARLGVSVDMINVFPDRVAFIVSAKDLAMADEAVTGLGLAVKTVRGCAKVSIVGEGMRGMPGVMSRLTKALAAEGVGILQTSDSHYSISCLVREQQMEIAARALHSQFELAQPQCSPEKKVILNTEGSR